MLSIDIYVISHDVKIGLVLFVYELSGQKFMCPPALCRKHFGSDNIDGWDWAPQAEG